VLVFANLGLVITPRKTSCRHWLKLLKTPLFQVPVFLFYRRLFLFNLVLNYPMKTIRVACFTGIVVSLTMCSPVREQKKSLSQLDRRAREIKIYAEKNGYSNRYCFLLDMRLQSGLKRFFVYDFKRNVVAFSGLVSHGSCDQSFLKAARFSNTEGGGCTSIGIYKVGKAYYGQYGKAYKLHGLENSNSNAYHRSIVLHSYTCVPEQESYPKPICNSSGCPGVSPAFLKAVSSIIDQSRKPVLLWIYYTPAPQLTSILRRSSKAKPV
jgi:hypothetical protein